MDMKGLGKKSLVLVCGLACLLAGCTASERGRTLAEAVLTEVKAAGMDTEADENESGRELLQAMMKLPGMKDKDTAGLFGGGEEKPTISEQQAMQSSPSARLGSKPTAVGWEAGTHLPKHLLSCSSEVHLWHQQRSKVLGCPKACCWAGLQPLLGISPGCCCCRAEVQHFCGCGGGGEKAFLSAGCLGNRWQLLVCIHSGA